MAKCKSLTALAVKGLMAVIIVIFMHPSVSVSTVDTIFCILVGGI